MNVLEYPDPQWEGWSPFAEFESFLIVVRSKIYRNADFFVNKRNYFGWKTLWWSCIHNCCHLNITVFVTFSFAVIILFFCLASFLSFKALNNFFSLPVLRSFYSAFVPVGRKKISIFLSHYVGPGPSIGIHVLWPFSKKRLSPIRYVFRLVALFPTSKSVVPSVYTRDMLADDKRVATRTVFGSIHYV